MNQQVGPSIVVSVLIVGFFAVALFPREPARARGSSGHEPTASRPQPADRAQSSPPRSVPITGHPPDLPRNPVEAARAVRADAPRPVAAASTTPSPSAPRAVIRKTSQPSIGPEPEGQPPRSGAVLPARPREVRQPAQAVTVVRADETIADVALRVYGTTRKADALWRANRDALPQRDSPLVPGKLLRTPTVP